MTHGSRGWDRRYPGTHAGSIPHIPIANIAGMDGHCFWQGTLILALAHTGSGVSHSVF